MRRPVISSPIPLGPFSDIERVNVNNIFPSKVCPHERAIDFPFFDEDATLDDISTYSAFSFTSIAPK